MRKIHVLIAILIFPLAAAAQGPAGAGAGSGPKSTGSSGPFSEGGVSDWQLAVAYQYNRVNVTGTPFNTHGANMTVTRYFGRWFGVDGQVGIGFHGNTGATTVPPNLGVHSVFVGGGPRLAYRGSGRMQPWAHFVIGLQDFRFTQTAGVLGNNKALGGEAGGGADFLLTRHFSFRVEADALGTRFFSMNQRHFLAISGIVLNF